MFSDKMRGKSYEQIYGKKRALEIRKKQSEPCKELQLKRRLQKEREAMIESELEAPVCLMFDLFWGIGKGLLDIFAGLEKDVEREKKLEIIYEIW